MATLLYNETEEFHTEDIMSLNHSRIAYNLTKALIKYDNQYSILPELEFSFPNSNVKPDIAICERLSIDWLDDVIRLSAPPLIAIEILSPRQALSDLVDKATKIYLPNGTYAVWIIIPTFNIVQVLTADHSSQAYVEGTITDSKTSINISLEDIFKKI